MGRHQIVGSSFHLGQYEHCRWLNDSLTVGEGEVRSIPRERAGYRLVRGGLGTGSGRLILAAKAFVKNRAWKNPSICG